MLIKYNFEWKSVSVRLSRQRRRTLANPMFFFSDFLRVLCKYGKVLRNFQQLLGRVPFRCQVLNFNIGTYTHCC